MPVKGSVAPIVIWCAVTPGTFAVDAPAPTIELPAVTRPRHNSIAVPVIVTRRVLVVTILSISPDLELLLRERRRHERRLQVTPVIAREIDARNVARRRRCQTGRRAS